MTISCLSAAGGIADTNSDSASNRPNVFSHVQSTLISGQLLSNKMPRLFMATQIFAKAEEE